MAHDEESARARRKAEGKRGQKHDTGDVLELQAKTEARLEARRGQMRESAQPLPDLEDDIENATSTVPAVGGSPPTVGGSSSGANVSVGSPMAVSAEDMAQTGVFVQLNVGIPSS